MQSNFGVIFLKRSGGEVAKVRALSCLSVGTPGRKKPERVECQQILLEKHSFSLPHNLLSIAMLLSTLKHLQISWLKFPFTVKFSWDLSLVMMMKLRFRSPAVPPPPRWPHSSEGLYSEQSKSVSMTHILLGIVMDCLVTPTEFPVQLQNRREQSLAMSGRASPNCCCAVALRHRKMAAIFCECRPDNCTRTSILQY